MDKTSQKLLKELSSIGHRPPNAPSSAGPATQKPTAAQEDGQQDRWRILLVELAYLIHSSLRDVYYRDGVKTERDRFRQLSRILDELDQMAVHDGFVRFRHRDSSSPEISEQSDYVIQFGNISVDVPAVISLVDRMGIRMKHLEGRLIKSFKTLADHGFIKLLVKLPGESPEAMARLQVSLEVISGFKPAVENKTAIVISTTETPYSLFPVCDEHNQPDPNLTLVAAVNNLDQNAMAKLLEKVSANAGSEAAGHTNVESILKTKGPQQRLTRPPLEVEITPATSAQSILTGTADGGFKGRVGKDPQTEPDLAKTDPSALKEGVARFVKGQFGKSPQTASQVMQSIYGMDYRRINSQGLGRRLKLVTDLLSSMQKSPLGQNVAAEVLRRIQARMDQVPDEILDDFVVKDADLKFWSEGAETTVSQVDKDLIKIIDHSKSQSDARKQSRIRLDPEKNYADSNFEAIASDFGIPAQDVADIIGLFKKCFDTQGNFLRANFEKKVSQFAAYEKKVFEILWEFLKETARRNNRLPLLYSLQLLVRETQQPIQAIKLLLAHFIQDPANVSYADRNAVMLVNQFLRSYIKESDMDIEMTPDEVLRVEGGLDPNAVNYGIWKIEAEQQAFLEKLIAIRKILAEAMQPVLAAGPVLPARFMLALEREVHIFLALVGGKTSMEVLRSALNVYGNPTSQIYHLRESTQHLEPLLRHLAAIVRGFARQADESDFSLLAEVKERRAQFRALHDDLRYHALVRQIMDLIDERSKF